MWLSMIGRCALAVDDRSVGAVTHQAEPTFAIVPAEAPMEMEVDVSPSDVGLSRAGDDARGELTAPPFQKRGSFTGRVRGVADGFHPFLDRTGPCVAGAAVIGVDRDGKDEIFWGGAGVLSVGDKALDA